MLEFEKRLGVKPIFGGFHRSFGTQNALLNLNDNCYLELLAADAANTEAPRPRWMGIDILQRNRITRWAVKSDQLEKNSHVLKSSCPEMGTIGSGSRDTSDGSQLRWRLTNPLALPEVELLPFMIDWSMSEKHPTERMPDMGCSLVEFYGTHPSPEKFKTVFEKLGVDLRIKPSNEIQLKAIIECPNGRIEI